MLLARSLVATVVAAGIAVPFVLPKKAVPLSTTAIRELHGECLTTMKLSAAVPIQDTRPIALQRGTLIDGRLRAAPNQAVIAANPFENVWRAPSVGGIQLATGAFEVNDIDIALPAAGPSWIVGRTHSSRQETSGGAHRDSDGIQGSNWHQSSQPSIALYDDATDSKDLIYYVFGADRFAEYKRVNTPTYGVGNTYKGVNGAAGVFLYAAGAGSEPDTYTLTDQNGNELTFFGFDADSGVAAGQLWTIVDPAGNKAYVGHATTGSSAISSGFDGSGRMTTAYDSSGRRFTYTYTQLDSVYRLTQVKAEKNTGSWVTVAQVDYSYYTSESYGDVGDLEQVTITTPLTDSGVSLTQKQYYRYYEGSYHASTNRGYPHALQYVYDFEGVRRFDWTDSTFDDDHLTATNASLQSYATAYFEYEEDGADDQRRITKAWFNGECGCSGANNGTYEFEYETNGSFSDTANTYDNGWKTRTVVQRPDTSYLTQYFDEVGQALSQVITDADPDGTSPEPSRWVTRVNRDSDGFVSKVYTPANCTGYTHSSGAITSSSSVGLIWEYTRGANATTGFVTVKRYREAGTGGTLYYDSGIGYEQSDKVIVASGNAGATEVIRPMVDTTTRYPSKTSTSSADYEYPHTLGWDGTDVLSLVSDLVTEPDVATGNNGSGTANTYTRYWRVDGTPSYEKARDGVLSYRLYTDGQLVTSIEDADTGSLSDEPAGLSSTAGAFHRVTTYTYDNQGRVDVVTHPDGRKTKHYYSKLADGRLAELVYADYEITPKFHGPVEYTITNQAGNVEAQATVGLASNESTTALTGHVDESLSDPITAMDLGDVVRLSTQIYSETGHTVTESRLYFDVPSSGAGSDGTNYDATFFGYDDSGRKLRVKAPHGTITRTVHDAIGRVASHWTGTNDNGWSGGEGSGTDNMVEVEKLTYDGGADDGNGYVTSRILYVEGSSTGQRETLYAHDAHGRVLLQTNPTAPHALHKYDNEGRNVATGLFSSTANIVVGTDDPTTETSNRLALTRSYFDEVGQLWKATRHKIDASDGSDDDNLEQLTWRDKEGRVIKQDGSQLAKTFYDRIGRTTHRFTIALDNDTTYAHADDVSGDYVAEETQTVYESEDSDDVVMSVQIDRTHDDLSTTGALDTNADADALLVTAANVAGRAQITCMWHDRFGRVTDTVQYGTNGGSNFDRDGLSVPSRSDTALVTSMSYEPDQSFTTVTDPRGLVAKTVVDDAGRTTKEIRNFNSGVNSGNPANSDDNQTVRYEYVDGLRTKIIADTPGTDQETVYIYGTTAGTPSAMKISTGDRIVGVKYPDSTNTGTTSAAIASDSSDVVSYAYNAQGQETYRKDQAGNVYETDYDTSGRRTHQRVTTLASGFDGAVRRQSWTYDSLGRASLVTQYDNATVGSGSVTDEVGYTYDGWGGITSYKQDKDSAVGGSGYYEMAYAYEKATSGRNTVRRTSMTLPGSKVITLDYSLYDAASRVGRLKDGATTLVRYNYLGWDRLVSTKYLEPTIQRAEYDPSTDSYSGYLDNFNRILKSAWWSLTPSPDTAFYDCDVSYDRNSNITWVEDNVHSGFDVKYTMDDLDRLTDAEEGTRSGSSIASRSRHQTWTTLDHLGNWDVSKLNLDGDDNWNETDELNETRTHNAVNELTARDIDTTGGNDYTLAYDAAGNMTDDGEDYEYEYDAFYRLRKVKNQSSTLLAEYRYNGLGHMIGVHEDTDVDGDCDGSDVWFYPAYDEGWREVARYLGSDATPKEQFVNATAGLDGYGGSSYINDVVCRNRDANTAWTTTTDGTLEERYYLCQNWRGDVSALVTSDRKLHEMDKYSPYGIPFGLPGGDSNSDGDNDAADPTQIQTWIDAPAYDVRGDVDLDGDVDSTDKTLAQAGPINGITLGWSRLGAQGLGNKRSFAGNTVGEVNAIQGARHRNYAQSSGRWIQRDPIAYVDGPSLYASLRSNPVAHEDAMGLFVECRGCRLFLSGGGDPGVVGPGCRGSISVAIDSHESGRCGGFQSFPRPNCPQEKACKVNYTVTVTSNCDGSIDVDREPIPDDEPQIDMPKRPFLSGTRTYQGSPEVSCGGYEVHTYTLRVGGHTYTGVIRAFCGACKFAEPTILD